MTQKDINKPKSGVFYRMLQLIKPYKWYFAFAVFLTLITAILAILRPWLIQHILDGPVVDKELHTLRTYIVGVMILILSQAFLQYFYTYLTSWLGQNIMRDLRNKVFSHISSRGIVYFDQTPVGALQTRTISDIETLNRVFSEGMVEILGEFLQLIFIFSIMFYTDWKLSLVVLTTLPLIVLTTRVFQVNVKSSFEKVRKYVSELNSFTQERLTGMLVTKIFGMQKLEYQKFTKLNALHRDENIKTIFYYSVFFPVVEIISALAIALLVWYGTWRIVHQELSIGILVAFILYIGMFFRPIRMMADQFNTLQMGIVAAGRIFGVLDNEDSVNQDSNTYISIQEQKKSFENGVNIAFKNLSFAYKENEPVLSDINFDIQNGTTTAIVGATGSGKTTIINLLCRFYEYQSGNITINNIELKQLDIHLYKNFISLVPQDVFLFSGSLRDNITLLDNQLTDQQILEAAKSIGVYDFINNLPQKLDFHVGERGNNLSTGQRQLIAFVRVILFNPKLLILDEATANIDSETETLIQNALHSVLQNRTSIIVAHRLSTIREAKQILVMKYGKIVESGDHDSLLNTNGIYSQLHQLQFQKK